MSTAARVLKGLGSLALLAALVGGIPWALSHFVGWPLPHRVPTAALIGRALERQGIPAQALVDALAVVVWFAWASLVASIVVEIPAALSGRRARRFPVAGIFQPVAGRLVAAVVIGALGVAARPVIHTGTVPLAARLPRPATPASATVVLAGAASTTGTGAPVQTDTAPSPGPDPPPASTAPPAVYVVQRGDTLWGIAERELGDPLRWSEIFALNEGRPQPDGTALTDPHWIDPGWTLLLPATTTAGPPAAAPVTAPPGGGPQASVSPAAASPQEPASTTPAPEGHAHDPDSHTTNGRAASSPRPVELPSGSVVAGSFAAGVLSAVAIGRLRRRHAYRYRPPAPGRDLTPPPPRPTLSHLASVLEDEREATGEPPPRPSPEAFFGPRDVEPGRIELARRGDETVEVDVTDLSGLAILGAGADDVARALVVGLLAGSAPGETEVLFAADVAERLVPGAGANRALRRAPSAFDVVRGAEVERIARARRLGALGAPDATGFRHENPEHPLPALFVLLDAPSPEEAPRCAALAADGPRLGVAVTYLGETEVAIGRLVCDTERRVTDASPSALADRLSGAQLFGLARDEAQELLDAVTEAVFVEEDTDGDAIRAQPANDAAPRVVPEAAGHSDPWPQLEGGEEGEDRPLCVRLLGHLSLSVNGVAVKDGLRSRAKMLLAWYLLRPEGATSEQAVDALWPDTVPDQVVRQFWRALGDLHTRLKEAGVGDLDVLVKIGGHYAPAREEIGCDLWDFQAALAEAATADAQEAARAALRRAVESYGGELLEDTDWPWVEPLREDLHRRALDAHLRLAEIEEEVGRAEAATAVLERAVELAGCAEEPYRRLMAHHARQGRTDSVRATWRLLQCRLAELDVEVEAATARLYRTLTAPGADEDGRDPRCASRREPGVSL